MTLDLTRPEGRIDHQVRANLSHGVKKILTGNYTVSYAVKLSRVEVIAAYPITPQTSVVEKLSEWDARGELKARFIKVESEHSAMASCIGASAAGARVFTATSAQGLALMHELLHWAVGARLPIVLVNVNRAMAAPWTIWCDHNDSLAQRDTGWLQFYCESNQEVLDSVIQAYRISEQVQLLIVNRDPGLLAKRDENTPVRGGRNADRAARHIPDPQQFSGSVKPENASGVRVGYQNGIIRRQGQPSRTAKLLRHGTEVP